MKHARTILNEEKDNYPPEARRIVNTLSHMNSEELARIYSKASDLMEDPHLIPLLAPISRRIDEDVVEVEASPSRVSTNFEDLQEKVGSLSDEERKALLEALQPTSRGTGEEEA